MRGGYARKSHKYYVGDEWMGEMGIQLLRFEVPNA